MPKLLVSLNTDLTEEQYKTALKHVTDKGGKIIDESSGHAKLAPFVTVEFPADSVTTLENGPHIFSVEQNGTITTQ